MATDLALCRRCSESYALAELLRNRELQDRLDHTPTPPGVWQRTTARGVALGASHRSVGGALGTLAMAVFWNGIVSVFVLLNTASTLNLMGVTLPAWFPAPVMNGGDMGLGMTLFLWIFLTPFLLVGAALLGAAALCLGGRSEVTIEPTTATIFTGLGALGWKRRFDPVDVSAVGVRQKRWTDSDGDAQSKQEIVLELRNGKKLKFGSTLPEERRNHLAALLQRALI